MLLKLCYKILANNPTKNCFIKGSRHHWRDLPPDKSLFHSASFCGLPIGNLTSQIFANIMGQQAVKLGYANPAK